MHRYTLHIDRIRKALTKKQVEVAFNLIKEKDFAFKLPDAPFSAQAIMENNEIVISTERRPSKSELEVYSKIIQSIFSYLILLMCEQNKINMLEMTFKLAKKNQIEIELSTISNENGVFPLIFAINNKNKHAVELLLNNGANPNNFNSLKGQHAIIFALELKQPEIAHLLLHHQQFSADAELLRQIISCASQHNFHAPVLAAFAYAKEKGIELMEDQIEPAQYSFLDESLKWALINQNSPLVTHLLKKGADTSVLNTLEASESQSIQDNPKLFLILARHGYPVETTQECFEVGEYIFGLDDSNNLFKSPDEKFLLAFIYFHLAIDIKEAESLKIVCIRALFKVKGLEPITFESMIQEHPEKWKDILLNIELNSLLTNVFETIIIPDNTSHLYRIAKICHEFGKYYDAFNLLTSATPLDEKGHYLLGDMFLNGQGCLKSLALASRQFFAAARKGSIQAFAALQDLVHKHSLAEGQFYLGKLFLDKNDFSQAETWLQLAFSNGYSDAEKEFLSLLCKNEQRINDVINYAKCGSKTAYELLKEKLVKPNPYTSQTMSFATYLYSSKKDFACAVTCAEGAGLNNDSTAVQFLEKIMAERRQLLDDEYYHRAVFALAKIRINQQSDQESITFNINVIRDCVLQAKSKYILSEAIQVLEPLTKKHNLAKIALAELYCFRGEPIKALQWGFQELANAKPDKTIRNLQINLFDTSDNIRSLISTDDLWKFVRHLDPTEILNPEGLLNTLIKERQKTIVHVPLLNKLHEKLQQGIDYHFLHSIRDDSSYSYNTIDIAGKSDAKARFFSACQFYIKYGLKITHNLNSFTQQMMLAAQEHHLLAKKMLGLFSQPKSFRYYQSLWNAIPNDTALNQRINIFLHKCAQHKTNKLRQLPFFKQKIDPIIPRIQSILSDPSYSLSEPEFIIQLEKITNELGHEKSPTLKGICFIILECLDKVVLQKENSFEMKMQ